MIINPSDFEASSADFMEQYRAWSKDRLIATHTEIDPESVIVMADQLGLDPQEFAQLAGRLLGNSVENSDNSHSDVLVIETVARITVNANIAVDEIEISDDLNLAFADHIRHIQSCKRCGEAILRIAAQYPTNADIIAAIS